MIAYLGGLLVGLVLGWLFRSLFAKRDGSFLESLVPWLGVLLLLSACIPAKADRAAPTASAVAALASATGSGDACEVQLARCAAGWNYETERCRTSTSAAPAADSAKPIQKWLATGDGSAFSASSAIPSAQPAPAPVWKQVDDLDALLGTWIDHEHGDMSVNGELVMGGVRVVFKKNGKKQKTPYSFSFWAPRPGHDNSKTVSGGCGFYSELHPGNWRAAYCSGYDHGTSIATHLKLESDGKKLRLDLDNWLLATLVKP